MAQLAPNLAQLGPTWPNLAPNWPTWPQLGRNLASSCTILAKLWPTWANLAPTWANLAPTWANLAPTWRNLTPTWPQLGPTWSQLGAQVASKMPPRGGKKGHARSHDSNARPRLPKPSRSVAGGGASPRGRLRYIELPINRIAAGMLI